MTDAEWEEFETYVKERLANEQSVTFSAQSWHDTFTFPWPPVSVLMAKGKAMNPPFGLRHDSAPARSDVLYFSCYRLP